MAHIIRVTGQALTCCPACQAHIRVAVGADEMACPFCGAALVVEAKESAGAGRLSSAVRGVLEKGRRGLLGASLLGLSFSVTACYGAPPPRDRDTLIEEDDTSNDPSDGRSTSDDTKENTTDDGAPKVEDAP